MRPDPCSLSAGKLHKLLVARDRTLTFLVPQVSETAFVSQ